MARLPRLCLAGMPQHVVQRGNNRQICFGSDDDFAAYSHWLEESAQKHNVSIHAWVFMTNHVHLLVTPKTNDAVSKMMQTLGRQYVRYFNHVYKRTSTLWEGRFKSCVVDKDNYFLVCQRYIELNPVRAGMVETSADYHWSSYRANGLGNQIKLHTPHDIYQKLGNTLDERLLNYNALFSHHLDSTTLTQIRTSLNQGMILGNNRFKDEVEGLAGRRVGLLKRGPKASCR